MNKFTFNTFSRFRGRAVLTFLALFMSVISFAQDGGGTVDVNIKSDSGGGGFMASPWVWVVGAAVFILLLVALLRGGSRKSDV
jgi:hypothetical protein